MKEGRRWFAIDSKSLRFQLSMQKARWSGRLQRGIENFSDRSDLEEKHLVEGAMLVQFVKDAY